MKIILKEFTIYTFEAIMHCYLQKKINSQEYSHRPQKWFEVKKKAIGDSNEIIYEVLKKHKLNISIYKETWKKYNSVEDGRYPIIKLGSMQKSTNT